MRIVRMVCLIAVGLWVLLGAGNTAGADDGSCSFSVTAASAGTVDITGTAPRDVFAKAFVNGGILPAATTATDGNGHFAMVGVAGSTSDVITVSYSPNPATAYPVTSCVRVGGEVVSVNPATGSRATANAGTGREAANATGALAFTGSSGTPSMALIGATACVIGVVLVIGLRHRAGQSH